MLNSKLKNSIPYYRISINTEGSSSCKTLVSLTNFYFKKREKEFNVYPDLPSVDFVIKLYYSIYIIIFINVPGYYTSPPYVSGLKLTDQNIFSVTDLTYTYVIEYYV